MFYYIRMLFLAAIVLLCTPWLLVLWLMLFICNGIGRLCLPAGKRLPAEYPPPFGVASIVVLNWNGKDLLAQGIPSILEAVRQDGRPHEVLVVDNGSTDGSVEYLRQSYPDVRILALPENLGFAEGNNAGVRAALNDVVVLLNNDMIVDRGFLGPLLRGFGPRTFAVSSRIYFQDQAKRREETGKTTAAFRRGWIGYAHSELEEEAFAREYYPAFWAGGGSSAFHRRRFLELGGFRKLYSPAYVEDTDLSYQAWSAGWEVLWAPQSIVYHKHRATSSRLLSPSELEMLITRNQLLFFWINIRDWKFLISHGLYLPWNLYRMMRDHGIVPAKGMIRAIRALPSAMAEKLRLPYRRMLTDAEVFEPFSKPGLYFWKRKSLNLHTVNPNASKPRLLWLTAYLPHTGRHAGAGRMFQLLKRLSPHYRITLLSFLETDDERAFLPEVQRLCESVIAMRRSRRRRWHIFAYEPFDEFRTPEMERALDRCLEESDFDLIQLEYTQMACYADRSRRIPTILTKHEVDFAACSRRARMESGFAGKARWFYNYLQVLDREVKLTREADAAVCMTDPDARELKRYCPSVPTHVINTGVDLEYFRPPKLPAEGSRLVFVGAFQHLPNVEAMIYFCREVLPLVRKETPCAELFIVGSNPAPSILGLSEIPGVHVTGFVADIRPFMALSAVYVVPLRLGVGIRGKILEAWSMAMAVVSTPVGCAGLRCEHGKNILIADSTRELAAQITLSLRNPELRQRLGAEGRRTAEQFYGWERSAGQLDALYRHYLNRPDSLEISHATAPARRAIARPAIHTALESRPHAWVE